MRQPPVPNRLVEVPTHLYELMERIVENGPNAALRDYKRLVRLAYSHGYQDGYRDGHTDAENGHDERVRAHVNSEKREEPDYLCDMCANGCDERRTIRVGQSAYDVCEKWQEVEE